MDSRNIGDILLVDQINDGDIFEIIKFGSVNALYSPVEKIGLRYGDELVLVGYWSGDSYDNFFNISKENKEYSNFQFKLLQKSMRRDYES